MWNLYPSPLKTPFTRAKKSARHVKFLAPCLVYPCRDYLPAVVSAPLKFWALCQKFGVPCRFFGSCKWGLNCVLISLNEALNSAHSANSSLLESWLLKMVLDIFKKTLFSTTEFFKNASVYGWVKADSQNKYRGSHLFLSRQKLFMERLTSQQSWLV